MARQIALLMLACAPLTVCAQQQVQMSQATCGPASCAPAPIALPFTYRSAQDVAKAREEILQSPTYLARASQAARSINEAATVAYAGANALLHGIDSVVDNAGPVAGAVSGALADVARDELNDIRRRAVINAMRTFLIERPDVTRLSPDQKFSLVRQALFEAQAQPDFSSADEMQNEAIRLTLAAVEGLNERHEILQNAVDSKLSLSDFFKAEKALYDRMEQSAKTLAEKPADNQREVPADSSAAATSPGSPRINLGKLARNTEIAAGQMQAAAAIAHQIGAPKLGKALNRGSAVVGLVSAGVQAYLGNPLGVLPAVGGVLGAFGGRGGGQDLSWIADYLNAISKQVEALAEQVQKNHVETMQRLEYIGFVAESTLAGVAALNASGLDACQDMIPASWFRPDRVHEANRRLDYRHPLVFAHYEELAGRFTEYRWEDCRRGMSNQFSSARRLGAALTIGTSRDVPPETSQALSKVYDAARAVYPREGDGDIGYLFVPASFVNDFGTVSYNTYVAEIRDLTKHVLLDPRRDDAKLLDPLAVDTVAGYALALHGVYDYTANGEIREFKPLPMRASPTEAEVILHSALAHVTLAIAQQQMMYGVVREFRSIAIKEQRSVLEHYFNEVKYAPFQLGRIVHGSLPVGERRVLEAVAKDEKWLYATLSSTRFFGQAVQTLALPPLDATGHLAHEVKVVFDVGGHAATLVFPLDGFETKERLLHSETVQRLAQLQGRIVMAIRSYRDQDLSQEITWLNAHTTFLSVSAGGS